MLDIRNVRQFLIYQSLFTEGFKELFTGIKDVTIDEGVVLKDPEGKLKVCDMQKANEHWQVSLEIIFE